MSWDSVVSFNGFSTNVLLNSGPILDICSSLLCIISEWGSSITGKRSVVPDVLWKKTVLNVETLIRSFFDSSALESGEYKSEFGDLSQKYKKWLSAIQ